MTPDQAIASLDRALANKGEDVILRRGLGTQQVPVDATVRAFVRGLRPEEIVGSLTQTASKVILSPTDIERAQWPGAQAGTVVGDPRVPRKGDKVVIQGRARAVEFADPVYVNGALVRVNLFVLGPAG